MCVINEEAPTAFPDLHELDQAVAPVILENTPEQNNGRLRQVQQRKRNLIRTVPLRRSHADKRVKTAENFLEMLQFALLMLLMKRLLMTEMRCSRNSQS